jgi:hypothetical protein
LKIQFAPDAKGMWVDSRYPREGQEDPNVVKESWLSRGRSTLQRAVTSTAIVPMDDAKCIPLPDLPLVTAGEVLKKAAADKAMKAPPEQEMLALEMPPVEANISRISMLTLKRTSSFD